MVKHKRSLNNV